MRLSDYRLNRGQCIFDAMVEFIDQHRGVFLRRFMACRGVGQTMKMRWTLLAAAAVIGLAACGSDAVADRDDPIPNLSEMVGTQGDWSLLNVLVDRPPVESELLMQSPITVDLNAMLGPRIFDYRERMAVAGPLVRNGTIR